MICNFENCTNKSEYGFKTQQPTKCKEHKDNDMVSRPKTYCIHNRQMKTCKECGGSQICKHKRLKQNCIECDGPQICIHKKRRNLCKECDGSQLCDHEKEKGRCIVCNGSQICEHMKIRTRCAKCCGSGICVHKKRRNQCTECEGSQMCTHKKQKDICIICEGSQICDHKKIRRQCNKCSPESSYFCKLCHYTTANKKYKGYCAPCYVYTYPEDELSKMAYLKYDELKVKAFIANVFPEIFTYNARIILGDCAAPYRRYIDFYIMLGDTLFAIEVDEKQHKGYDQEDEETRINEILHNIGLDKKMVFIRFNPSPYKVNGKQKRAPYEKRLAKLEETIIDVFTYLADNGEYPDIHTEIKLFFDQ